MPDIIQTCRLSGKEFIIDEKDQAFYERIGMPLPTITPDERQRRRMSWRNERNFYARKCDMCEKQMISIYDAASPHTIYCNDCWWSDKWEAKDYGQEFDFSRPFFEQFAELQLKVPRLALYRKNCENCDYINHSENDKNCYLCVDIAFCENVYHSKWMIKNKDCIDCHNIENSELCYEVQYQEPGYNNKFSMFSLGCSDSAFVYYCIHCKDCFMCSNLNRKQYYIYNQYVGKEKYEEFMSKVDLGSYDMIEHYKREYEKMVQETPKDASVFHQCENCTGDLMDRSKNVHDSYEVVYSEDCRYCYDAGYMKDCYDTYESAFNCELQYECHGCNNGKYLNFAHVSYDNHDANYIDTCHNSGNLFGCIGMRHGKYCVLNKQYSKEEYEELVPRIIEHMQNPIQENTHASACVEYGEFFPTERSLFGYNETLANDFYPLTKDEALARGYKWKDDFEKEEYQGEVYKLPDNIKDTPDDVCKKVLKCKVTGQAYKIIPQELELYRRLGVALPRRCPNQRFRDRMKLQNARALWPHTCAVSGKQIMAPYPPDRGDTVYSHEEFLKMLYG